MGSVDEGIEFIGCSCSSDGEVLWIFSKDDVEEDSY